MKTETKYDVDYFIRKFESIPEELWCIFSRANEYGQRCAHGWCHKESEHALNQVENEEELALVKLAKMNLGIGGFATINNGVNYKYQQPTPKQRILAALYDIKKMQDAKDIIEEPKTEYIVVEIDRSIREQTKELVMN